MSKLLLTLSLIIALLVSGCTNTAQSLESSTMSIDVQIKSDIISNVTYNEGTPPTITGNVGFNDNKGAGTIIRATVYDGDGVATVAPFTIANVPQGQVHPFRITIVKKPEVISKIEISTE